MIKTRKDAVTAAYRVVADEVIGRTACAEFMTEECSRRESGEITFVPMHFDKGNTRLYFRVNSYRARWLLGLRDRKVDVWAKFTGGSLGDVYVQPKIQIIKVGPESVICSLDTKSFLKFGQKKQGVDFVKECGNWVASYEKGLKEGTSLEKVLRALRTNPFASVNEESVLYGHFDTVSEMVEWVLDEYAEESL